MLLDVDGTLLDIAPTPESVMVPPRLPGTLAGLHRRLDGALAIVSGRPLEQIDALLGHALPAAAEHGAVLRVPPLPAARLALPQVPQAWRQTATALEARLAGVRVEDKALGFVMHYRAAPQAAAELADILRALAGTDPNFEVMPADMAFEIRPRGADKGTAVNAIMAGRDFTGRLPLFIGDDVTDRDGMRAAQALGGVGLLVEDSFGTPGGVRAWLDTLQEHADAAAT